MLPVGHVSVIVLIILILILLISRRTYVYEHMVTCAENEYMSGTQCVKCPTGSMSNRGATDIRDCVCIEPDLLLDPFLKECRKCEIGTYINVDGNKCIKCPEGTTSSEGAKGIRDCVCPVGSELTRETCTLCKQGFYKSEIGNQLCVKCPFNSTTKYEGSVDVSECQCIEKAYFDMASKTCQPCPSNTHSLDNWTFCVPCYGGKLLGHQCTCPPGRYLMNGYCVDCPHNYHNKRYNSTSCAACPAGQGTFEMGQTDCQACPPNSTSQPENVSSGQITRGCLCNKGYYMKDRECIKCTTGTTDPGALSSRECK
jgi:hypothetical protein